MRGGHWQFIASHGTGQDDVVTHIIVDPRDAKRLYASTWTLYSGGGGVYRSDDAGHTWNIIGLAHETVRALAQSPTDPKLLLAGALSGVYRSTDEGASWNLFAENNSDLSRFDSVAFDPKDNNTIYAVASLALKTSNGGKDWFPVVKGMIDDSDVIDIMVDPSEFGQRACHGVLGHLSQRERRTAVDQVSRNSQCVSPHPIDPHGSLEPDHFVCRHDQRFVEDSERQRL